MVQLRKSANLHSHLVAEPETTLRGDKVPVKLEIVEDPLEDEHEPNSKRSKPSPAPQQQWSSGPESFPITPAQYNPLGEPSPLGLSLRKSPSLLDLIQMRLSGGSASVLGAVQNQDLKGAAKKEGKGATSSSANDKLKASNFHASILRIGSWEYKSRYEGDLVGKCYFAKHKLVWEVLEGGLKSKIEIQWSDITALRANCPDDAPGTLNVVLARQPLFFRETNPQPRKHTLWQATSDFTDGQASTHRQHFLQCAEGLLNKHFEKLLQCDMRLNFLSRQPEIILNSPYFDSRASVFEDLHGSECYEFNQVENFKGSSSSGFLDLASPSAAQSSSLEMEKVEHPCLILEQVSREAPSPSSGMDTRGIEGGGNCEVVDSKGPSNWDQIKAPGLHLSMSMSDLMNHIGHCISEQMGSGNLPLSDNKSQGMLEDMTQYLLSDAPLTTPSDEKCLMSRVNSLCCLLQKDPSLAQTSQFNGASCTEGSSEKTDVQLNHGDVKESEKGVKDASLSKQTTAMSRKLFWRSAASSSSNCISSKILS